jgi:hypothetical protein
MKKPNIKIKTEEENRAAKRKIEENREGNSDLIRNGKIFYR